MTQGRVCKSCYSQLKTLNDNINELTGSGPSVDGIVAEEEKTLAEIHHLFPRLRNVSVVNDESDPLKGWWKIEDWRAQVQYSVSVMKNILNHKRKYFEKKSEIRN